MRSTGRRASAGPAAIAVLPFVNMSGDGQVFLRRHQRGHHTGLSKLLVLRDCAQLFLYLQGKSVHEAIAEELGVGYVVEGSVRQRRPSARRS
jgi:TolB-like protein